MCTPRLRWSWPRTLATDTPPRVLLLRTHELVGDARLVVAQDGRALWRGRRRLVPNRSIRIPARWAGAVEPHDGPVRLGLD